MENEDLFVEFLSRQFSHPQNIIGIGDDCAVLPQVDGTAWLITTDALVEGIHFLKDQISARDLGYKTVAVNVSDIVAMGGDPKYAFLSIALPSTIQSSWAHDFIEGLKEACKIWNVSLLGGDTVGSKRDIFINLTMLGSTTQNKIKTRNLAQSGDVICVTGYLGDSGGGLKALQNEVSKTEDIEHLIHKHFHPTPSPTQGKWLASHQAVHAMMDISDGLECDLKRLLKKSHKGALIETTQIPLSPHLLKASEAHAWDLLQLALTGGEDYCLLCTVSSSEYDSLKKAFQSQFQQPLFAIGYINDCENLVYTKNNELISLNYKIFNHF